jgi:glycosyltransferase involved in cell wall biosynthesis
MRDQGHKVTFFVRKQNPSDPDMAHQEGVDVIRYSYPAPCTLDPFRIRRATKAAVSAGERYLAHTKWDVVHIHIPSEGNAFIKMFGLTPKYVYTVHSPLVLENQISWSGQGWAGKIKWLLGRRRLMNLEGKLLKTVDRIHTLSNFTKEAIDSFHGVGPKTTVISHWCRKDFYRQNSKQQAREILKWPVDAKILFTLRSMTNPRYGLDICIKAIAPLIKKYNNLYFVLGGWGKLRRSFEELAKALGVQDKVWFLGMISDDTLKRCYEAADLFILPTRALECFGLIALEALGMGLPIVSTDASALPEMLRPISPQMIVPAGNIQALQDKLEAFIKGSLEMPSSSRISEYLAEHYSFEVVTPQIIKLLEDW